MTICPARSFFADRALIDSPQRHHIQAQFCVLIERKRAISSPRAHPGGVRQAWHWRHLVGLLQAISQKSFKS
ncbi:hypothetical protein BKM07_18540 [Pseudomonas syringae group genomosp. 3]|uniref:Secreted protein n=1 Tax=Pseudomonas syringae group genomosp. 3 TaxID=251701 RepID=A0ABD6V7R3_9PSED|nr:hypothetical protein BKM07_18540 [Pseudomonas syringae group genomosp. 3]